MFYMSSAVKKRGNAQASEASFRRTQNKGKQGEEEQKWKILRQA